MAVEIAAMSNIVKTIAIPAAAAVLAMAVYEFIVKPKLQQLPRSTS